MLKPTVRAEADPALESFLEERIYEFNVGATGISDGDLLYVTITDRAGATIAGVAAHTWGGCCELRTIWVSAPERGRGIGTALMEAAETEARRRGCGQIVLSTHSFQAPGFYEKLGYEKLCAIPNYPRGHENIIYIKTMQPGF